MKKLIALALACSCLVDIAQAQTATVSTSETGIEGVNLSTSMQNASASTYCRNDGNTLIAFTNNSGEAVTGTLVTQRTEVEKDGYGVIDLSDETISIPSESTVVAGPFPTGRWNTTSQGTIRVNLTGHAGISATCLSVQ